MAETEEKLLLAIPAGEDVCGTVKRLVLRIQDDDGHSMDEYTAFVNALASRARHFNDEDTRWFFQLQASERALNAVMDAHLARNGDVRMALTLWPLRVTRKHIDDSGLDHDDVLKCVAMSKVELPRSWLDRMGSDLGQRLLCLASESHMDRQGHADLVPALMQAGDALRAIATEDAERERIHALHLAEMNALRLQAAWAKRGAKTVCFESIKAGVPGVPVYATLLVQFAPGYFSSIVPVESLPSGSSFKGPLDMEVRAQQAFARAVELGANMGADDRVTISRDALDRMTLWEGDNGIERPVADGPSSCTVSEMELDFASAAHLAAFCRAITTRSSDPSHKMYKHVAKAYAEAMSLDSSVDFEMWCEHVWPLDDITIDMYTASNFVFSESFDKSKQNEIIIAQFERRESKRRKTADTTTPGS